MTSRTLTIRIERDASAALDAMASTVSAAWKTGAYQGEFRVYGKPEQLFRVFTPVRWGLLEALQKLSAPIGLRPLARLVARDPSSVLRDLNALAEEDVVEKDAEGKWLCPFAAIHTDFTLARAA